MVTESELAQDGALLRWVCSWSADSGRWEVVQAPLPHWKELGLSGEGMRLGIGKLAYRWLWLCAVLHVRAAAYRPCSPRLASLRYGQPHYPTSLNLNLPSMPPFARRRS